MIRTLRSPKLTLLWLFVFIIAIPSFVLFYGWQANPGMDSGSPAATVATLNYGLFDKVKVQNVDVARAQNSYTQKLAEHASLSGLQPDRDLIRRLDDYEQRKLEAVREKILERIAADFGVRISEQDVLDDLRAQVPPEQRPQVVRQLAMQGMTLESYAAMARYAQTLEVAQQLIAAAVRPSVYEAWLNYASANEQFRADVVRLDASRYLEDVTFTSEEVETYFREHAEKFRVPDQVQFAYIAVTKDDLKTTVTVTDDDVTSAYQATMEDYRLPRAAHVRQILLKRPDSDGTDETTSVEAVRLRAREIYDRAAKQENFTELAREFSEEQFFPIRADDTGTTIPDALTTEPGNLGLLRENMARVFYGDEWTSQVFGAQRGTLLPPIETQQGFHIVRVETVLEGNVPPIERVADAVRQRLIREKVQPLFDEAEEAIKDAMARHSSIEKVAEETGYPVQTTARVDRGARFIPGIGPLGEFFEVVNDLVQGGGSELLSNDERHLVIELQQEFPAHDPSLDDARPRVEDALRRAKAVALARADAEKLQAAGTTGDGFEDACHDLGTTPTAGLNFGRDNAVNYLGMVDGFDRQIDGAKARQAYILPLVSADEPEGFVVYRLDQRIAPDAAEFRTNLRQYIQRVRIEKSQVFLREYLDAQMRRFMTN